MAQVTRSTHQHIDLVLSHLLSSWSRLPEAANEIDGWDLGAQIAYVEEWTPDEQLLDILRQYDRDGVLTAEQTARYQELLALVRQHRPLLNQLRES